MIRNYLIAIAVAMFICFAMVASTISVMNIRINEYQRQVNEALVDLYNEVQRIDDNSVDMRGFVQYVEAHR